MTATARWFRDHWVIPVGVVALIGLLVAVDPSRVGHVLVQADVRMLALMLPTVLVLYVVHGVAWWIALRGAGIRIRLRHAVGIAYISQTFTFLPGGDLWRVPLIETQTRARIEVGTVTATVVFDDLLFFLVLTMGMIPAAIGAPILLVAVGATLVPQLLFFTILLWPWLYGVLASLVTRVPGVRRFERQLLLLGPAFRTLVRPRTLVPIILLDVVAAALQTALFALALQAVHASSVGLSQVAFTYSLGQVGSALTVIPASLGAYEGLMTGMIAAQGVPAAAAALAAILYRAFNDVLMGLLGFALAVLARRRLPPDERPAPAHA